MSWWLVGGLAAGLIIVHMARPRFQRRIMSSAHFFSALPPAKQGRPKWRISNPVKSRPLLLQLPILLLLLAALIYRNQTLEAMAEKGFGVWLIIDTSGSMLAMEGERTRLELALDEAEQMLKRIREAGEGQEVCIRLSSFDQEVADLAQSSNPAAIRTALKQLKARTLGTDLELVRGQLASLGQGSDDGCPITHLVVISDMPTPDWVANDDLPVIWRHVGEPVPNVGFTHADALRDPLTGLVRKVRISVTAYGDALTDVRVVVKGPGGDVLLEETLIWDEEQVWRGDFSPTGPGRYHLDLSPGGAWTLDDHLTLRIADERQVRVDWQHPDRRLPRRLGWVTNNARPHLRVHPFPGDPNPVPTLYIGNGYRPAGTALEVSDFLETSALLEDLNLDVAEELNLAGIALPEDFEPVLRTTDGRVLLAQRMTPPAAFIPGLPTQQEASLDNFSAAIFFNAVKFLMGVREPAPLYQLTGPGSEEDNLHKAAIHPGEGNTARLPASHGEMGHLQPVVLQGDGMPLWPLLLLAAVLLFLLERLLATYGGGRWR